MPFGLPLQEIKIVIKIILPKNPFNFIFFLADTNGFQSKIKP